MVARSEDLMLNPNIGTDYSGVPYPFGMDPVRMNLAFLTVMVFGSEHPLE